MYTAMAEAFTLTVGFALIQRFRTYPAATTIVLAAVLVTLTLAIGALLEWRMVDSLCDTGSRAFFPRSFCIGLASY